MRSTTFLCLSLVGLWLSAGGPLAVAGQERCAPTPPDSMGPFYKPDAPQRASVGEGYELMGVVRSAADCAPVPGASIELWLANPKGVYDDHHRATITSDSSGAYRFLSNRPPDYGFRPPHIHMRVTAEGFKPLVTQHYPEEGAAQSAFDLVLSREGWE